MKIQDKDMERLRTGLDECEHKKVMMMRMVMTQTASNDD
jgi:hypothetical protein